MPLQEQEQDANGETELDRVSSARLVSTLDLLIRILEPLHPAPADSATRLGSSSHGASSSAWRTHPMAIRQACHARLRRTSVRDPTRRVLGLGGPAHLNVSLTRDYKGLLFLTFSVIFLVHRNCSTPGAAALDRPDYPPWPPVARGLTRRCRHGSTPKTVHPSYLWMSIHWRCSFCVTRAPSAPRTQRHLPPYDVRLLIAHNLVSYFLKSLSTQASVHLPSPSPSPRTCITVLASTRQRSFL